MAVKKNSKVDEIEEVSIFEDGDYFTAQVRNGNKTVKIRGIAVESDWGRYELRNNQFGEEVDCDDESGFSFGVHIRGNTLAALQSAGVYNFSVVTDKRIIKIIENDKLPEIAGHQPRKLSNGDISFGCGAIELSAEDVESWVSVMEKLKKIPGYKRFLEINDEIVHETSLDDLLLIDLADVKKLLQ